jgi:hypothetical protein
VLLSGETELHATRRAPFATTTQAGALTRGPGFRGPPESQYQEIPDATRSAASDDRRRMGQEDYLSGVTLTCRCAPVSFV